MGLLYSMPGFDSRLSMEIPLLTSISEDIGMSLNNL
jgi:hypothetical protein